MDLLSIGRMLGALTFVLGLLALALWAVRRFNIVLPARAGSRVRRIELIERSAIDSRRTLVLLRRDDREHLLLIGPEGALLVESNISRTEP